MGEVVEGAGELVSEGVGCAGKFEFGKGSGIVMFAHSGIWMITLEMLKADISG